MCPDIPCSSLPMQLQFMRAARTDKGVSAVGQVVSFKMRGVDKPGMLADVQSHLPAQIKLFGFVRVTNSFDARWGIQGGLIWFRPFGVVKGSKGGLRHRYPMWLTCMTCRLTCAVQTLHTWPCQVQALAWAASPAREPLLCACCPSIPAGRTATGGATSTSCRPGCSTGRWGAAG